MLSSSAVLDWLGCALGLLGAYALAFNMRASRYGWVAFLGANITYIALAHELGVRGLFVQQLGFMGSSMLGIYRSFIARPNQDDAYHECSWGITARLAALPMSSLEGAPADLALLVRQARTLHPEMARAARDREQLPASGCAAPGAPCEPIAS